MEVIAIHVYQSNREDGGLLPMDPRYRRVTGPHLFAASNRPPQRRQASVFSRAVASVKAYAERRRVARDLYALNDYLLADIGLTREDIPAVVNGTFVRQPESAPIERPLGLRPAHATGSTAGSVANDNELQIAA